MSDETPIEATPVREAEALEAEALKAEAPEAAARADGADGLLGGRYHLGESIGSSSVTDVYRGTDTVLGRTVAVKTLSPSYASDPAFADAFDKQAKAAARISHPNVAAVFDCGVEDGRHWVAMEYVEGRTLAQVLSQDPRMMPERAIRIAEDVCKGLGIAHSAGIVHRDLRPNNIMITRPGVVKVMDFGIARRPASAENADAAVYLSPEQARGEIPDQRSDVYSLGVVLYEMLAGRPPFSGDSAVAVAYQHAEKAPTPPSQVVSGLPAGIEAVVMRALAKDPADRYVSADRFLREMEAVRGIAQAPSGEATQEIPELAGDEVTQVIQRGSGPATIVMKSSGRGGDGGHSRTLRVAAIAAVVLLLSGGLALLLRPNDSVSVPNLVGATTQTANEEIRILGLHGRSFQKTTVSAAPGTVISQDPAAGSSLRKGGTIDLVIAVPPAMVTVPNITGWTTDIGSQQLQKAGLVLGNVTDQASSIQVGIILTQSPPPNSGLTYGSSVDVTVSAGPQPVAVQDLTCMPLDKATALLAQYQLQIKIMGYQQSDLCSTYPAIVTQYPVFGQVLPPNGTVEVWTNSYVVPSGTPTATPSYSGLFSPTPSPSPSPTPSPTP